MKKAIFSLLCVLFLLTGSKAQDFYDISFKDINGNAVSLSTYTNKKILFFILPLEQSDSSYRQLQVFINRYADSIKVIGILSLDDGYNAANAAGIQNMYSRMGILLTEPMNTKKASGARQSVLMKWLTDKNRNRHFDVDAAGVGHKFFVSGGGRLYAVMPPRTSLDAPIIERIVHSTAQ